MEKISAACAMDWSIELEKELRSTNPSRRMDAIAQIGQRLHQWSKEPNVMLVVLNMYSLVPGEDRLFANTILLRLADAFRNGDNCIRRSIVRIFLVELKDVMKKGTKYNGILSKQRVVNSVELLKRVKMVFDTGDVEAKALALRLFGCWADLGKDSVHIRYIILTSLQSSHVLEVKAALFAAGCFCRLSEDFACIVLEMLIGIVSLPHTSHDVKLDAIRSFSKMRCSLSVVNRAYKVGKSLILNLQQEELQAEMLASLSKLAFSSSIIISQQVDFLLSSASHESPSLVRAKAIKYVCFLSSGGTCCFVVYKNILATLVSTLDDKELSPDSRLEVLHILHKIFHSSHLDLPCIDMFDFFRLVLFLKYAAESSFKEERCLALSLLVNILCTLKIKIREHWSSYPEKWDASFSQTQSSEDHRDRPTLLACDVILLIVNEINSIVKQMAFVSKQEFTNLLNLIQHLLFEYPSLARVVFDRLRQLVQTCSEKRELVLQPHGPDNKKQKYNVSELILCICRFTITCLKIIYGSNSVSSEVYHIVKSVMECIRQNGSCDTYEFLSLDLHSNFMLNGSKELKVATESGFSQERRALEFSKSILRKGKYWEAYRVGIFACSTGAWFAAAFTLRKLMDCVQSDSCRIWIRSLILLAGGESELKLILFPKLGSEMINRMQKENDSGKYFCSVEKEIVFNGGDCDLRGCEGKFLKIRRRICASEEILVASCARDGVFYFQRWFLSLRSKVLEIITDLLGFLDLNAVNEEQLNNIARLSLRMNNIAKEYDLLAVSFLDVDSNSLRNISRLALSCSVLAFCTSFALCFVNRSNMVEISQTTILKALIERLWNIDEKSANELRQLMTSCKEVGSNLQSRTETKSYGFVDKESLFVYKSLVESVLDIQGDSKRVKDDEGQKSHLLQGIQSLSGIIRRWIEIPCSTPKYFFRVRPCIGAELFIFNAGSNSPDGLSITRGIQFPLNLCIQLKNASRVTEAGIAKIYCILAVKSSDRFIKQAHWGFRPRETDEMVELHDILLHHIRNESMENAGGFVTTCVYFELNQRGQGFSTCLLDVSALPEGLYPIKWHSSCVDKKGHHWSLLPLNHYPVLTIKKP